MVTAAKPKVGGAVQVGPTTATLPKTADAALTGFESLGYISDAGLVRTIELDNDTLKAWGGDVVLVLNNGKTEKFKFAMIDSDKAEVLKLVHGDENVNGTALKDGISIKSNNKDKGAKAFVIDMIEAENTLHRICIPSGMVTDVSDITYVDNGAVSYEVEITAIADSDGNTCYEYLKTASAT